MVKSNYEKDKDDLNKDEAELKKDKEFHEKWRKKAKREEIITAVICFAFIIGIVQGIMWLLNNIDP
jgi:hypothetical protein